MKKIMIILIIKIIFLMFKFRIHFMKILPSFIDFSSNMKNIQLKKMVRDFYTELILKICYGSLFLFSHLKIVLVTFILSIS